MGLLSREEAERFEEHFFACARCSVETKCAKIYVQAMRAAAMKLRQTGDSRSTC